MAGSVIRKTGWIWMTGIGRVHVYYGYGKGKTTAAMGQIIRAAGCGLQVLVFQFLKDNTSNERKILEILPNVTCLSGRSEVKFYRQMTEEEKEAVKQYNEKALNEIVKLCSQFDVVVLDEALCAVKLGLLNEERLLDFLRHRPKELEVVLTGHEVSERVKEEADYVTEMRKVKHPYDRGQSARAGIEF